MIIWETIAIVGLVAAVLFGAKSVRDFFLGRRMARSIKQLAHENEAFKDNVEALIKENAELAQLKADLASELDEFKQDLSDLKGICSVVGEVNADALEKLRAVYSRHKALLEAEIRASALRILLLLQGEGAAGGDAAPHGTRRRLAVLFPEAQLERRVTAECVADPAALRRLVETLLRESVLGSGAGCLCDEEGAAASGGGALLTKCGRTPFQS